jgi:hypothetical protein
MDSKHLESFKTVPSNLSLGTRFMTVSMLSWDVKSDLATSSIASTYSEKISGSGQVFSPGESKMI